MENNDSSKGLLKEVWLLCDNSSYGGIAVRYRIFATLGDWEINEIATEIATAFAGFHNVIRQYVSDFIRKELAKGEKQILIEPDGDECTSFYIYKVKIDSGIDWSDTCDTPVPTEEDTIEVFKGSSIYASTDYYGDVEALYSTEWLEDMIHFTVE